MYELIRKVYDRFKALGPHSSVGEQMNMVMLTGLCMVGLFVVALLGYLVTRH